MASVHKQVGSRFWIAHFSDKDGRRRARSTHIEVTPANRKKAQRVADAFEGAFRARNSIANIRESFAAIAKELGGDFKPPTVAEFLADWMQTYGPRLAESSRAKYSGVFKGFTDFLGPDAQTLYVDMLTDGVVRSYRDAMLARLSPATINTAFSILAGAFQKAVGKGYLIGNPFEELGGVSGDAAAEKRPFTLDELKLVLSACDAEWRSMVLFGLYTGQRLSDIGVLTWGQIDTARGTVAFVTGKTKRRMELPIAAALAEHIATLRRGLPGAPVHPEAERALRTSAKASTLSRRFNEILASVNLVPKKAHRKAEGRDGDRRTVNALSFHSLRHTAATWLRDVGASEAVSREIIGHASASVDRGYVHTAPEAMRAALDKLPSLAS